MAEVLFLDKYRIDKNSLEYEFGLKYAMSIVEDQTSDREKTKVFLEELFKVSYNLEVDSAMYRLLCSKHNIPTDERQIIFNKLNVDVFHFFEYEEHDIYGRLKVFFLLKDRPNPTLREKIVLWWNKLLLNIQRFL